MMLEDRKGVKKIIYTTGARIPPFLILIVLLVCCPQRNTSVDRKMAEIEAHLADVLKGYMTLYSEFYVRSFSHPTNNKTLNTKRYPDYRPFVVDYDTKSFPDAEL